MNMPKTTHNTSFDLNTFWNAERAEHQAVIEQSFAALQGDFQHALDLCVTSIESGGKIMFFGNGGSAADAQHLATELAVRYVKDRKAIAAMALTTDTSALTAGGNDMGFDQIFVRQIEAIGKPGDIAIGISTSGNSANVINALRTAQDTDIKIIGLGGRDGGKMKDLCDVSLIVPSNTTARIQEIHIILGHMLCGALEQRLGLV